MTISTSHAPDAEAPSPAPPPWRNRVVALAVVGVVVVGIAAFAVNRDTTGDTGGTQALGVRRIAATRTACEQWLAGTGPATDATPASGWCADMTGWMSDQMVAGPMMGTTMWNSTQSMGDACHQWAATVAGAAASATTGRCDQMVAWMSQHIGRWNGAQDWDSHMGDWGAGMMTR
ncbi:MAG: hypothetical protein M3066_18715 [Actinomycetota bacterium]|nr:hypothetical protein [Actinomycetota bacterium]